MKVKHAALKSETLATALALIESNFDKAVSDLSKMVSIDTSFPPGRGYVAFADLMSELLTPLDFDIERLEVPRDVWFVENGPASGDRINVVARRETGRPVCGLYYHVDTVPVAPGWKRDPLSLTVEGDKLYGLGAADMKGTIAATLLALDAAKKSGLPLFYDPMLLLCTDEEGGLYPGIRYLAEQKVLKGHILNFNGSAAPRIWAGCFGIFNLQITVSGAAVHAGEGNRTGAGVNAIDGSLPILNALSAMKAQAATKISSLTPPPHSIGPLRPSLNIAAINGGTAGGQVPAEVKILVSRRYAPEESFEELRSEIERQILHCVAGSDLKIDFDLIGHLIPTEDPDGPHWPRWQKALSVGFGYSPEDFSKWGAASASDFGYVQKAGFGPEILLGGLGRPESLIHSPEEHTTRQDIVALAKSILSYLAADFAAEDIPENQS